MLYELKSPISSTLSVFLSVFSWSAKPSRAWACLTRARFELPCPLSVSSGVAAEPLDLKWLTMARNWLEAESIEV